MRFFPDTTHEFINQRLNFVDKLLSLRPATGTLIVNALSGIGIRLLDFHSEPFEENFPLLGFHFVVTIEKT
jgi:hypothetical protein